MTGLRFGENGALRRIEPTQVQAVRVYVLELIIKRAEGYADLNRILNVQLVKI